MYSVYEFFPDGKSYWLYSNQDKFECECWAHNHGTVASNRGKSVLRVVKE